MPGESPTGAEAQALWDEVAKEREAGTPPSDATPDAEALASDPGDAATEPENDDTPSEGTTTDEPGDKPAADATPKKDEPADPYAGLSPELKLRLQRLEDVERQVQQLPQLIQRVNTAEGRVAAMQREKDVAKRAADAVKQAPSKAQIAAAAASTEKWDSLKSDFPEWADATEQYVAAKLAGLTPQEVQQVDPNKIAELIEHRVNQAQSEMAKAVEEAKVEGKHPNWREDINTDGFGKWFGVQPPEIQALARSDRGRDAIRMLDLYHEALAKPADKVKEERANKLAAAVSAKPGASGATTKSVDEMTPQELWNFEAKQAAKRQQKRGLTYI